MIFSQYLVLGEGGYVLSGERGYSHILGHYICAAQLPPFFAIFPPDLPPNLKAKHLTCLQNFEFSKSDENSPRHGQLNFCLFSMNSGHFFFHLNWLIMHKKMCKISKIHKI